DQVIGVRLQVQHEQPKKQSKEFIECKGRYGYHGQVSEVLKFFEKMKKVGG
ncbi:unnamed protein product, partial [Brassica oleracea]